MGTESRYTSPNTGGIKRGDSAETGDLEARPTPDGDLNEEGLDSTDVLEDLEVKPADDPSLGITNIGAIPPDDPIADDREPASRPPRRP